MMRGLAALFSLVLFFVCAPASLARTPAEGGLPLPPETYSVLTEIYSFDLEGALEGARSIEQTHSDHPLGYLLEGEALWWKIWCTSAEYRYGMTDSHRRPKLASDHYFFELAQKVSSLAEAQLRVRESAEMHFYDAMGLAMTARLYGLRGEARNTARAGVHSREHFLRAITLDPQLVDADLGLGLYNYYIDTLSGMTKVLRFFMGIPGGSKQEGIRQLERAIANGQLTPDVARFYLAIDLHRYDQQYQRALAFLEPLVSKYPSNPLFQLACGDLYAKLGRKEKASASYHSAADTKIPDPECRERVQKLVTESLAALGSGNEPATH